MERWRKPEPEPPRPGDSSSRSSLDCSAPLRSARSSTLTASASPFFKLSAELSSEPLRIPGAVPFLWEQSPGRRKTSCSIPPTTPLQQPRESPSSSNPPVSPDLAKRSLGNFFRQSSTELPARAQPTLSSAAKPRIAHPPALERPRSSTARQAAIQRPQIPASALPTASFPDETTDAASDSVSDAFTATAGGISVDDSVMLSGPLRLNSTPSEARDFIMHRFLPAAKTIACESPQTPSRRFVPVGLSARHTAAATCCHGSFRDYGRVACMDSPATNGSGYMIGSALPYASPSIIATERRQVYEGSFHTAIDEFQETSEEDDEEEHPVTPKSCGFFPFRIHISIHHRRSTNRSGSTSKHPRHKNHQSGRKGNKMINHAPVPKRIIDILQDDPPTNYEDDVQVHNYSGTVGSERERTMNAAFKQTGVHSNGTHSARTLYASDRFYKESPQLHQNCSMWPTDLSTDEASEHGSFCGMPSRFCSPSPAASYGANVGVLHRNCISALTASPHDTRSCVALVDGNPHPALTCPMEQHAFHHHLCHCDTYTRIAHACTHLSSPSSCLNPPLLHPTSSQDRFGNHDVPAVSNATLDGFLHSHRSEQQVHVVRNALNKNEDKGTNSSSDASVTRPMSPSASTELNKGSQKQPEERKWTLGINSDTQTSKIADKFHQNDGKRTTNGVQDNHESNANELSNANNRESHRYSDPVGVNCVIRGNTNSCNTGHGTQDCHVSCARKGNISTHHDSHCMCSCQCNSGIYHAVNGEKNGDVYGSRFGIREFPRSPMVPPPPKSPTHSWLDRAIPPIPSATSKSPNRSSRFSYLHHNPAIPAAAEPAGLLKDDRSAQSTDAYSNWEALVKGSHLQPGLQFSKVLSVSRSSLAFLVILPSSLNEHDRSKFDFRGKIEKTVDVIEKNYAHA